MGGVRQRLDAAPPTFRTGCVLLGFLVGTLIHFSSLGGSYILTFQKDGASSDSDLHDDNHSPNSVLWLSLLWSLLTSSLGVLLLFSVRLLLGITESTIVNMEFLFAFGALNGVSVSWLLIDTLLGGGGQFQVSAVTVMFTVVWFRVFTNLLTIAEDDADTTNPTSLSIPLLGGDEVEKDTLSDPAAADQTSTARFRALGLLCGTIIGLFIQFGSLGANFIMQQVLRDNPPRLLVCTLVWSFLCSTMGIGTLLLIRNMVATAWPKAGFAFLLTIECFFAIGATLGLNAAWTLTDVVLGFQTHATENLLGLLATMLWCKLVLYCTSSCDLQDDPDCEDSEKDELLIV